MVGETAIGGWVTFLGQLIHCNILTASAFAKTTMQTCIIVNINLFLASVAEKWFSSCPRVRYRAIYFSWRWPWLIYLLYLQLYPIRIGDIIFQMSFSDSWYKWDFHSPGANINIAQINQDTATATLWLTKFFWSSLFLVVVCGWAISWMLKAA